MLLHVCLVLFTIGAALGADVVTPFDEMDTTRILPGKPATVAYGGASLTDGLICKALMTDGVDGWVDLGQFPKVPCLDDISQCTGGIAVATWINIIKVQPGAVYVTNGGHTPTCMGVAITQRDGKIFSTVRTAAGTWEHGVDYSLNTWFHLALVWTPAKGLSVYKDAQLSATITVVAGVNGRGCAGQGWTLGRANDGMTGFASMKLDDLHVWSHDITKALVEHEYEEAHDGCTEGVSSSEEYLPEGMRGSHSGSSEENGGACAVAGTATILAGLLALILV